MSKSNFQLDDVKAKAQGLWADTIFPRFNIDVRFKKKTPCPACGGRNRFRYDDKNGAGDYICQQCGAGDGISLIQKVTGLSFLDALSEVAAIVGLDATSNITDEDRTRWRKDKERRDKEQRDRELKRQEQISRKAEGLWRGAYLGESSLYLKEKQVDKDPNIKITHDGNLLIPAYDENGKMWNLQTIEPDGHKFFILGDTNDAGEFESGGGRTGGCFFMIGEVQPDLYDNHIICVAEGYPSYVYKVFRDDDLTEPMTELQTLEVAAVSKDSTGLITFDAKAPELNNVRTGVIYDYDEFPLLRGI